MRFLKFSLTTQMFLALLLGCLSGLTLSILQWDASYFKPLGDLFIRLIRMIVVPLVITTLIAGAASMGNVSRLGKIAVRSLVYYTLTTAVAVAIGLVVANFFQLGSGLQLATESVQTMDVKPPSLLSVFLGIVPVNPIHAMAEGNMLEIIFFSVFLGLSISAIGKKGQLLGEFFESMAEAMLKLTGFVMLYAPIGVFGLMTFTVGTYGIEVLLPLVKLIAVMFIACIVHIVIVYLPCIRFTGIPLKTFFGELSSPLLIAFSSASSAAALSLNLVSVQKLGASKEVSSFTIPLGNTINMDGTAIYMGICAIFAASIYGIPMPLDKQITIIFMAILAAVGTMGVPGAGIVMISMVFSQVGIPLEAIALIAGVDRILDMMRTTLNVLGDATGALLVSKLEKKEQSE